MPRAAAACWALGRSREAMAAISHHSPRCMAGMTFFTAILAAPRTPQRTLRIIPSPTFHDSAFRSGSCDIGRFAGPGQAYQHHVSLSRLGQSGPISHEPLRNAVSWNVGDGMMRKVRWGVLGAANIAVKKVIPAMHRGEWCEIAAIASRDLPKAQQAAAALGIPKSYGSYEELLADPEIEAVYNPL